MKTLKKSYKGFWQRKMQTKPQPESAANYVNDANRGIRNVSLAGSWLWRNSRLRILTTAFLCIFVPLCLVSSSEAQLFPKGRRDTGPKPKNIHGLVSDLRGKPLAGARVFVKDVKTNVVRTLTTDQDGIYKLYALPPTVD